MASQLSCPSHKTSTSDLTELRILSAAIPLPSDQVNPGHWWLSLEYCVGGDLMSLLQQQLNIDGALTGNAAGVGGVFRSDTGAILHAYSEQIPPVSSAFSEANALYIGLLKSYLLGYCKLIIETDCKSMVEWFKGDGIIPWHIIDLWSKVLALADYVDFILVHSVIETNKVADGLSKQGANGVQALYYSYSDLPQGILKL